MRGAADTKRPCGGRRCARDSAMATSRTDRLCSLCPALYYKGAYQVQRLGTHCHHCVRKECTGCMANSSVVGKSLKQWRTSSTTMYVIEIEITDCLTNSAIPF